MIIFNTTADIFNIIACYFILYDNIIYFHDEFKIIIHNSKYEPYTQQQNILSIAYNNIYIHDLIYLLKYNKLSYKNTTNLYDDIYKLIEKQDNVVIIVNKDIKYTQNNEIYYDFYSSKYYNIKYTFDKLVQNTIIYLYEVGISEENGQVLHLNYYNKLYLIITIVFKLNICLFVYIFFMYFIFRYL